MNNYYQPLFIILLRNPRIPHSSVCCWACQLGQGCSIFWTFHIHLCFWKNYQNWSWWNTRNLLQSGIPFPQCLSPGFWTLPSQAPQLWLILSLGLTRIPKPKRTELPIRRSQGKFAGPNRWKDHIPRWRWSAISEGHSPSNEPRMKIFCQRLFSICLEIWNNWIFPSIISVLCQVLSDGPTLLLVFCFRLCQSI